MGSGLLGLLVARRQPGNPEGWLLLVLSACAVAVVDCGLYAVLDYRVHHGRLPLGEVAVFMKDVIGPPLIFVFVLVVLLFPDGRLTRRWTWVLGCTWPWSRWLPWASPPARSAASPGSASRST
jgi:hypothetical protein